MYSITRVSLNKHVLNNHCIIKRRYTVYNIECTNISYQGICLYLRRIINEYLSPLNISGKLVLRKGRLNIRNVATQSDIELSDL